MGKVIRLTESDLVKIIKRVLNEDMMGGGVDPKIMECLSPVIDPKKMSQIPTCMKIFNDMFKTQTPPNPFDPSMVKCSTEMIKLIPEGNPFEMVSKIMEVATCIMGKMGGE